MNPAYGRQGLVVSAVVGIALCAGAVAANRTHAVTPASQLDYVQYSQSGPTQVEVGTTVTQKFAFSVTQGALQIIDTELAQAQGGDYTITSTSCNGLTLQVGATCEVDLLVRWVIPYEQSAQLALNTSSGFYVVQLHTATPTLPLIYSTSSIDFGSRPILSTTTKSVLITNPNPASINLTGGFDGGIVATNKEISGDADACDRQLPNGSCSVAVLFTPTSPGPDSAHWDAPTKLDASTGQVEFTRIEFTGNGSQTAVNVDLSPYYNVYAMADGQGGPVQAGGLDTLGNAYAALEHLDWLHENFLLGPPDSLDAVANATVAVPPGNYYSISMLGMAVFGPLGNRPFILQYSDGTVGTVHQGLSDWKTPMHYANEEIASSSTYRYEADGKTGHFVPYYLYGYSIPTDHTRQLVSIKLPPTRDVIIWSMNLETTPPPTEVDLSTLYNVIAVRHDGTRSTTGGIDGMGSAMSFEQLSTGKVVANLMVKLPLPNVPDAVTAATIPLPHRQYTSVRMLGMGVNGMQRNAPFIITYTDGSVTTVLQTLNDWRWDPVTPTGDILPGESEGIHMYYRLAYDGTQFGSFYILYEYQLPLDPTKTVATLELPPTRNVVITSLWLQP